MTSYTWNGVSGDWSDASDWTPTGGPPTSTDSATINGSATDSITIDTADVADSLTLSDANATLNDDASLTIGGMLTMSNGTLNIDPGGMGGSLTVGALNLLGGSLNIGFGGELTVGALTLSGGSLNIGDLAELELNGTLNQTGGTLALGGGTICGGTIKSTAGTLVLYGSGNTLSGVTVDGPLNLTGTIFESVLLADGTTVVGSSGAGPGTINVTGENFLGFENTQTVSSVTINLGGSSTLDEIDLAGAGDQVLTLASTVTVEIGDSAQINGDRASGDGIVNKGVINQTGGSPTIFGNAFTNSGTIDAKATNGSLAIDSTTFTNRGKIHLAAGETVTIEPTVTGKGTDTISGASTLEFAAGVSSAKTLGDQDIDFTGAGTLDLLKPTRFTARFPASRRRTRSSSWAHGPFPASRKPGP
jgi:hypothetical protein